MGFIRLTIKERKRIETYLQQGCAQREIARRLKRDPSTICREIARNGKWLGRRPEKPMPNNRYSSDSAEQQSVDRRSKYFQAQMLLKENRKAKKTAKKSAGGGSRKTPQKKS